MKLIGRIILLLLILSVFGIALFWVLQRQALDIQDVPGGDTSDLKRSVAYELTKDQWVSFPLPATTGIRVLNTPLVDPGMMDETDARWGYALEYELLGQGGKELRRWIYHYRTGITRYIDPETGLSRQRAFVDDMMAVPIGSRSTELQAGDLQDGKVLRVRIHTGNPNFSGILVRSYLRERQAEYKLGYLWDRMDENAKARFAGVSVYGFEYLREGEKENLLRWRWRPIGPAGVYEVDFIQRIIYTHTEDLAELIDDSVLPEGIYVDSNTRGVLPIPPGPWDLSLQVIPVKNDENSSLKDSVNVHWQGRDPGQQWYTEIPVNGDKEFQRKNVEAGMVEFTADRPLVVRAYISKDGQRLPLFVSPSRLRTYLSAGMKPVDYTIEHTPGMLTPVRVDLRRLWTGDAISTRSGVHYQMLDSQGKLIEEGDISLDTFPSSYDRVSAKEQQLKVSEPMQFYFQIDNDVAILKFMSIDPVSVAVFTRPADLRRYVRAPEDYENIEWDPEKRPAWFYLRAQDHEQRIMNQGIVDLLLQTRPRDIDLDLAAGRYQWIDYEPKGHHYARQLLVPRSSSLKVPQGSRAGVYSPLPANRNVTRTFTAHSGRTRLSATLIYVGDSVDKAAVEVYLDGYKVTETMLFSSRAEIRLPEMTTGRHTLKIITRAKGNWLINYGEAGAGAQLIRRAWGINTRPLQFIYRKETHDDETLTGTLYCKKPGRTLIDIDITNPSSHSVNPKKTWTFRQRTFDLRIDPARVIPTFDNPDEWLNMGQRFFLPLAADLPAAGYNIKIRKSKGDTCYMTLHRLLPGQPEIRRFFREQDLVAGGSQ